MSFDITGICLNQFRLATSFDLLIQTSFFISDKVTQILQQESTTKKVML